MTLYNRLSFKNLLLRAEFTELQIFLFEYIPINCRLKSSMRLKEEMKKIKLLFLPNSCYKFRIWQETKFGFSCFEKLIKNSAFPKSISKAKKKNTFFKWFVFQLILFCSCHLSSTLFSRSQIGTNFTHKRRKISVFHLLLPPLTPFLQLVQELFILCFDVKKLIFKFYTIRIRRRNINFKYFPFSFATARRSKWKNENYIFSAWEVDAASEFCPSNFQPPFLPPHSFNFLKNIIL